MTDDQVYCSCGEIYHASLAACPKCGTPNSYPTHRSGSSAKLAVVGMVFAAVAALLLFSWVTSLGQADPIQMTVTILQSQEIVPTTVPQEELVQYALQLINRDRQKYGLAPVQLSLNQAAQVHAEDVYANKQISHWMSNGEKPYMTYSRLGGYGSVHQNVAISGFSQAQYDRCVSTFLRCERIDPVVAIEKLQYEMMYNDKECCNDGHRDNILDPHHTHVSIGIFYDDYYLAFVQNFENDYGLQVHVESTRVNISGPMPDGPELKHVLVYYDPLPTRSIYDVNKKMLSYGSGKMVASVLEPLPLGFQYQQPKDYVVIEAQSWKSDGSINIWFDMSRAIDSPGVYTLYTVFEKDGEQFPATSYSVFITAIS